MNDDRFDDQLRQLAEDFHQPPETPTAEMWTRITAARSRSVSPTPGNQPRDPDASNGVLPLRPPFVPSLRRYLGPSAAIAALLLLGIGIGRWTRSDPKSNPVAARLTTPSGTPTAALRVALAEHLTQSEVLLTRLRTEPLGVQFQTAARDLLSTTRMLLDAKSAMDPKERTLLEDLELVLTQIALLQPADGNVDLPFIADGLTQHNLMSRLRTAIPAGRTSDIQGEL